MPEYVIVGDVGGTKVRFALARKTDSGIEIDHIEIFRNADFADFSEAVAAYLGKVDLPVEQGLFAMAGPVDKQGSVKLTNRNWPLVRPCELKHRFGLRDVTLVNDFAAMARAIPEMPDSAFEVVLEVGVLSEEAEVLGAQRLVALLELAAGEVAYAEAVAARFVHVGRADALEGRADFGLALRLFRRCVEQAVGGSDEVGAAADVQVGARVYAGFEQLRDFAFEDDWIDDHTVAHYVLGAFAKHAAGDGVQHVFDAIKFQGVSGVGAALEPCNHVVLRGEHVHDFAFAFVAPLEAEQDVNFHASQRLFQAVRPERVVPVCGRRCSNCGASPRCQTTLRGWL